VPLASHAPLANQTMLWYPQNPTETTKGLLERFLRKVRWCLFLRCGTAPTLFLESVHRRTRSKSHLI